MNAELPRIPLPRDADLPEDVREALAQLPPLNVFRMVAGLPRSFRPFLQLGGSILTDTELDARIREIAILRVAHATHAPYEWAQHAQLGRSVGVTEAELEAIASDDPAAALDEEAALVCRAADEISHEVRLSDEALALLLERYGSRGAAAMIFAIAYYNFVSRVLESTRVELEDEQLLAGQTPGDFGGGRADGERG